MVKNLKELMVKFQDEEVCRRYLIQQRWNGSPVCPHCDHTKIYTIEKGKRFKCANSACYKKFSVTVGTVFEASNIPLTIWFPAIYIITAHKKGISSVQLAKDLGVTQKTAWFMTHRIREALREKGSLLLTKEVQADEVYIGGKEEFKHKDKKSINTATENKKVPVVGLIETGGGKVVTQVMPWVTKKNISEFIKKHLDKEATLVTDAFPVYLKIGQKYNHQIINHSEGQFAVNGYHTNGIEGYWSLLRRGIIGIYHQLSAKHLQRYCDEFSYRFNRRLMGDGERFTSTLSKINGRLSYKTLVNGQKNTKEEGGEDIKFEETLW